MAHAHICIFNFSGRIDPPSHSSIVKSIYAVIIPRESVRTRSLFEKQCRNPEKGKESTFAGSDTPENAEDIEERYHERSAAQINEKREGSSRV